MTIARPTISAVGEGLDLSIRDDSGRIILDSSQWPHATATIDINDTDGLLDALDPRDNTRATITVNGRTFDLGIREANPNRKDGTIRLALASDEALLDDYSQLLDDRNPRNLETSIRAVTNYVLNTIGAHLEPGGPDADVTAYWEVTNLLFNPGGKLTAANWSNGGNTTVGRGTGIGQDGTTGYIVGTAQSTTGAIYAVDTTTYNLTAKPGTDYVFSLYLRTTRACQARPRIYFLDGANKQVAFIDVPAWIDIPTGATWTRVTVMGRAPVTAAKIAPFVSYQGMVSGQQLLLSEAMLYEGVEVIAAFNGATGADAHYTYDSVGDLHASASTRHPIIERRPESLIWKAGDSGLAFLSPVVQASGLRLVCNERRQWTLRTADHREPGAQSFRIGVNISDIDENISREVDEWFDGAVYVYTWTDADGIEQTRTDAYALPGATKIIRRDISAPYPGPGRARYAVDRAQGRGRTITAARQATWTEDAEQAFTATLDSGAIQVGVAERTEFDLSTNVVTTTSRTTDTPVGAIELLPGTIDTLLGTIDTL